METAELEATPSALQPAQRRETRPTSLDLPAEAQPVRADWNYLLPVTIIHLLALFVFLPWCFSWSGVFLAMIGCPLFGMLGINLCYHRVLTHRGMVLPKWFEHLCALLGVCCLQDSPARWVAVHRLHHRHSDRQPDPHTPLVSFFWAHVGWLMVHNTVHDRFKFYEQYARDVLRDPFYMWLERNLMWFWVFAAHAIMFFASGLLLGWALTGRLWGGVQLGTSWLVWGVFCRTVIVWHGTWSVNSLTHMVGYRNYETSDDSRNYWFVALLAYGEGWHNNHHADQRAAAHGHKWWEFDLTYQCIRLLEMVGLAKEVVRPRSWRQRAAAATLDQASSLAESEPELAQSSEDPRS